WRSWRIALCPGSTTRMLKMRADNAGVSFIIPHRGRQDLLLSTLTSIAALETEGTRIEIVVVTQDVALDGSDLVRQLSSGNRQAVTFFESASSPESTTESD